MKIHYQVCKRVSSQSHMLLCVDFSTKNNFVTHLTCFGKDKSQLFIYIAKISMRVPGNNKQ